MEFTSKFRKKLEKVEPGAIWEEFVDLYQQSTKFNLENLKLRLNLNIKFEIKREIESADNLWKGFMEIVELLDILEKKADKLCFYSFNIKLKGKKRKIKRK